MPHTYRAHGLAIISNHPIDYLPETDHRKTFDLKVHFSDSKPGFMNDDCLILFGSLEPDFTGLAIVKSVKSIELVYRRDPDSVIIFTISDSYDHIEIRSCGAGLSEDKIAFLIGPVLGIVCRLKGMTCLHSSVLGNGTAAFALVGHKGQGKSTAAASLIAAGADLITDDVARLEHKDGQVTVNRAYPFVRLTENTIRLFGIDPLELKPVYSTGDKRFAPVKLLSGKSVNHDAEVGRLPLRAIYVLEGDNDTEEIAISSLSNGDALRNIMAHQYARQWPIGPRPVDQLGFYGRLVQTVSIRSAKCPRDLSQLSDFTKAMSDDFNALNN